MRVTFIFLVAFHFSVSAQIDSNYIQLVPRDKTIQLHTTVKDVSVTAVRGQEEKTIFRNSNWATGVYFKWGLAELFFAVPHLNFENTTLGAERSFGTGFGLNFYNKKLHYNYNFKYIQGFDDFQQILDEKLGLLTTKNTFFFNRLNIHYIHNSEQFSMRSALRFNDRQLKSAGSYIVGFPISYHFGGVGDEFEGAFEQYSRAAVGAMIGYGYTYVFKNWAFSCIAKGGADLRYSSFWSRNRWGVAPSFNLIGSSVYYWDNNFIGAIYNNYPEWFPEDETGIRIVNWKLRIYAGKRF